MNVKNPTLSDYLWLLACTLAGVALRLPFLATRPLWSDEFSTLLTARRPFVASLFTLQDSQPPLYQILLRLFTDVQHRPPEWAFRLPALVAGCLVIPAAWCFVRTVASRSVAAIAVLLVATNPVLIHYSREARPYSLFLLLAIGSMTMLWRVIQGTRKRDVIVLALVTGLLFYTHYYAIFLVAGQIAFLSADWFLGGRTNEKIRPLAAAYTLALLAALPVLLLFARLVSTGLNGAYWIPRPTLLTAIDSMGDLLGPRFLGPLLLIPLLACLWPARSPLDKPAPGSNLIPGTTSGRGSEISGGDWWGRRRADLFCLTWIAAGLLLPILGSMFLKPGFTFRYAIPVAVPLIVLSVRFLRIVTPTAAVLAAALLVGLNLPASLDEPGRMDGMRAIAGYLTEKVPPGGPVYVLHEPFSDDYVNPESVGLEYYGLTGRPIITIPVEPMSHHQPDAGRPLPPGRAYVVCFSAMINPLIDHLQRQQRGFKVEGFGEYLNVLVVAPIETER